MPDDGRNRLVDFFGGGVRYTARRLKHEATQHHWRDNSAAAAGLVAGSISSSGFARPMIGRVAVEIFLILILVSRLTLTACLVIEGLFWAVFETAKWSVTSLGSAEHMQTEEFFSYVHLGWTLVAAHICTSLWPFAVMWSRSRMFKTVVFAGLMDILAYGAPRTIASFAQGKPLGRYDLDVIALNAILAVISLVFFVRYVIRAIQARELTHAG